MAAEALGPATSDNEQTNSRSVSSAIEMVSLLTILLFWIPKRRRKNVGGVSSTVNSNVSIPYTIICMHKSFTVEEKT